MNELRDSETGVGGGQSKEIIMNEREALRKFVMEHIKPIEEGEKGATIGSVIAGPINTLKLSPDLTNNKELNS